jgi:hypothetical protein
MASTTVAIAKIPLTTLVLLAVFLPATVIPVMTVAVIVSFILTLAIQELPPELSLDQLDLQTAQREAASAKEAAEPAA